MCLSTEIKHQCHLIFDKKLHILKLREGHMPYISSLMHEDFFQVSIKGPIFFFKASISRKETNTQRTVFYCGEMNIFYLERTPRSLFVEEKIQTLRGASYVQVSVQEAGASQPPEASWIFVCFRITAPPLWRVRGGGSTILPQQQKVPRKEHWWRLHLTASLCIKSRPSNSFGYYLFFVSLLWKELSRGNEFIIICRGWLFILVPDIPYSLMFWGRQGSPDWNGCAWGRRLHVEPALWRLWNHIRN